MKFNDKTIRLIAIGASVAANCQPCLLTNSSKARENGADDQEIAEAIQIGKMVRKAAASKIDKFTNNLAESASDAKSPAGRACGCQSN